MSESEDRTQPASPRRRQLAREQGQAAYSPELSAAAGWLVVVTLLACFESTLVSAFVELTRSPLIGDAPRLDDAADLASLVQNAVLGVSLPVGILVTGFGVGAFLAHQLQTRGLWAPAQLAPDVSRLWRVGRGGGAGAKLERCVWSIAKAVVLIGVVVFSVRSHWGALQELSLLEFPEAASRGFAVLLAPAWRLGAAMALVGLVDYGLRFARFETLLRSTPDEQREDQRTIDGDPKVRAARRRLAHALRDGADELLTGTSLVLTGGGGLIVVLVGGPPPRKVFVRVAARGRSSTSLRKAVARAGLPVLDDHDLALRIASQPAATSSRTAIVDPLLIAQLRGAWPVA